MTCIKNTPLLLPSSLYLLLPPPPFLLLPSPPFLLLPSFSSLLSLPFSLPLLPPFFLLPPSPSLSLSLFLPPPPQLLGGAGSYQVEGGMWEWWSLSIKNMHLTTTHFRLLDKIHNGIIPYSRKLLRKKTGWKLSQRKPSLCRQQVPHPQISQRKLLRIATKPWNSLNFTHEKFFCCTVYEMGGLGHNRYFM